jgi:hypothetical protein
VNTYVQKTRGWISNDFILEGKFEQRDRKINVKEKEGKTREIYVKR